LPSVDGALDNRSIQSGVALRLPPHSKFCRSLRRARNFYQIRSWGLCPTPGSPAEHLGWGGSLYATVRYAL